MTHPWIALAALIAAVSCVAVEAKTTYTIDIGGPMDELFIGSGWYAVEGPYPRMEGVYKDAKCRWAAQGAMVRLPVFPGVVNTVTIRGGTGGAGQRVRCFVNGEKVTDVPPSSDSLYSFEIAPRILDGKGWADLRIETEILAARSPGDSRDLRIAVDWIKVSADAPSRNYVNEMLAERAWASENIAVDQAPTKWRMRYDPNNVGDTFAPNSFAQATYDDSAFDVVPTTHVLEMRRGDVAWYRTWVILHQKANAVRKALRLPGEGFERDGLRKVWVSGQEIKDGPGSIESRAGAALADGPNTIVVKLMKGPLPRAGGHRIVEQPRCSGRWSPDEVLLSTGPLALTKEFQGVEKLSVKLLTPSGRTAGKASKNTSDLGDGRRGIDPKAEWKLTEYGEHTLYVEDGAGHSQWFPVHFLGIHLFHWGWYSAHGGTQWNGFNPCSNDYIDQLFSRLGDHGSPHHSITWGGAILEPGTGFHKTEKVDYIAKHREAIEAGQLEFVGAPFPPRNICTDFGETLLRSMRRSLALYESQFGIRPNRFVSHDSTVNPMLPQIMLLCGYDTYCQAENWWGQGRSIPGSRDCYWRTPDGSRIRMLDSWYHGISPTTAARRAIEQGKHAVLCNEEFACLDRTVFLEPKEMEDLAAEGIFLKPITLSEYQRITEAFAREYTYQGDDALCYKGWTGGGEGEVEYEKANRLLETRLVALDNMVAFARYLGIEIDYKPIDEWWNLSLRWHECHNHWGNGYPELTAKLWEMHDKAVEEMVRIAGLIAAKTSVLVDGITAFNPLGFRRDGLVPVDIPAGTTALVSPDGAVAPVQRDPDRPGAYLASLSALPSCGYRRYTLSTGGEEFRPIRAAISAKGATLDNGAVRVHMAPDGSITSVVDCATGAKLMSGANQLYLAKPQGTFPDEPLSRQENPLNLAHYVRATASAAPRLICEGPVISAVEFDLTVPGHTGVTATVRVSLAAGERQARVRLTMAFKDPTVICPPGAPGPHEGTYFPGIFVRFPMPIGAKPLADMAYCTTDGVLTSTNHETFMKEPFRNGTFNTLSMAGPNSGEYSVLTRGLPDFFAVRKPSAYLGMSLGVGAANCPYKDSYVHEYTIFASKPGERGGIRVSGYKTAQSFLVEPIAVKIGPSNGDLPSEVSFASLSNESTIIPGIECVDGDYRMRVLNLSGKTVSTKMEGILDTAGASLSPNGAITSGVIRLGPCGIREVRGTSR